MSTKRIYVADFETTVYKNQERTDVWAAGIVELYQDNCYITNNIADFLSYIYNLKANVICYFHNLKFDGSFILDYLLNHGYKQSLYHYSSNALDVKFLKNRDMPNNTFKMSVSDKNLWYKFIIKKNNKIIEFRDSYKLLPFTLKKIAEDFKTEHKKLTMEYEGYRQPYGEITMEEREYLKHDLYVLKEAMEIMFDRGHTKLTIGSCCLSEYKGIFKFENLETFDEKFPDLTKFDIDSDYHGCDNAYQYVRKSYRGGWCYVNPKKTNKIIEGGITFDVNSLYPYVMHSMSGFKYPVGNPVFFKYKIPEKITDNDDYYYFVRFKCRFLLKDGYLPTLQIKNNWLYKGNEYLTSSRPYVKGKGYVDYITDEDGNAILYRPELTMTMYDFKLFTTHYRICDFTLLDGCYFRAESGIYDTYIDKYREIKESSTGAERTLAKLYSNNLYGKFAMSDDSSFKIATMDGETVKLLSVEEHDKTVGYIPCGTAITSHARYYTITHAQQNYHHFIYSDTDSIHLDCGIDNAIGFKVDDRKYGCWKCEATWDQAIFVRQKTYIEHVVAENLQPIAEPYYNITCAGMPDYCKNLFSMSLEGEEYYLNKGFKLNKDEHKNFLYDLETGKFIKRTLSDFRVGLTIDGQLKAKRIPGGIVLREQFYTMKK